MAIAKKLRFCSRELNKVLNVPPIQFPPDIFKYNNEKFYFLGKSNKEDFYPDESEFDGGMYEAVKNSEIGQYTYCNDSGDIFEAFIYIDEHKDVVLRSLRTRLK